MMFIRSLCCLLLFFTTVIIQIDLSNGLSLTQKVECKASVNRPVSTDPARRVLLGQAASAMAAICSYPQQSYAAQTSQMEKDKANILKGYNRLNYLLDNWEKETTVCKTGNDNPYLGCDRTPIKVMEYLGYKSTEDPLFRADKTLQRLQSLVPAEKEAKFQDALDVWIEKAEEGNGMAFISSWGEANPGGGKDRVALFIERSRKDVTECRDSLGVIIGVLGI